jgi:uncharacterized phage protein gp47/JayE
MPLNLPSLGDIINRIRADIVALIPSIDPTIFGTWVRGFTDSNAGRHYDNVRLIEQLQKELFPQTAAGADLDRWAQYEGITRFAATVASGNAAVTGVASTIIPAGTSFRSEAGNLYTAPAAATISARTVSVSSLTRSGSTVTAVTTSGHEFGSNMSVTIAGAVETDYNGTFAITVLSATSFSYEITGTPTSPATGTITAACDCATLGLTSDNSGQDQNLANGAILNLTSPIAGVDTVAYVQFAGIIGGQDQETDAALLVRVLQSRSNPVANFNVAAIEKQMLSIQGVTRVLVKRITPRVGAVTCLFVRDNDDNIIPSASEVNEVRAAILEILPATSDEDDVIVTAPTPVTTNYTFIAISPDTTTMRAAIEANLEAFYTDEVDFETTITQDKYRAAIINTIDPETGDTLDSFTLSTPTGDINIGTDEIGVLGSVVFS